jgi:HEAT repeat protein
MRTYPGRMRPFEPGYEDPAALLARAAACTEPAGRPERAELIGRLHRRADAAAFAAAAEAARSADLSLRLAAVDVLGQLGYAAGRPYREQTLPILLAELDDAEEPSLLQAAVRALAHLGDGRALIPVLRHAAHRDPQVRGAVAAAVPALADPRTPVQAALDALIELSRDADEQVRDWSTFGLGELLEAHTPALLETPELRAALAARLDDAPPIADRARSGLDRLGNR